MGVGRFDVGEECRADRYVFEGVCCGVRRGPVGGIGGDCCAHHHPGYLLATDGSARVEGAVGIALPEAEVEAGFDVGVEGGA